MDVALKGALEPHPFRAAVSNYLIFTVTGTYFVAEELGIASHDLDVNAMYRMKKIALSVAFFCRNSS